jgi:glycosyltransferase involved in cell wall biosynthesis
MKFSVVMAVYQKDHSVWLNQAIQSLLRQTLLPNDIVIVIDGPVTPRLNATLRNYKNNKSISIIRLSKNQGLGNALNVGIKHAKNELIARMDADDIAVPNRFELQIAEFKKNPALDILGGHIAEFTDTPDEISAYRKVPVTHDDIKKFSRRRSPFNHPTVMYKKSVIQKLGGYDASAIRIEDYDLWLRALTSGVQCANLDLVLLNYRSTQDAMKRRKTFTSLRNHIKARARFYDRGYISLADFMYGVATQTLLFIIPTSLANTLFKRAVRNV